LRFCEILNTYEKWIELWNAYLAYYSGLYRGGSVSFPRGFAILSVMPELIYSDGWLDMGQMSA